MIPVELYRGGHSIANHTQVWEKELNAVNDSDTPFILSGIREGFRLTTAGSDFQQAEVANYGSTRDPILAPLVHKQIQTEVDNRYIITQQCPTIISALGAIPKNNNKVMLIHDCSRPEGYSLNSYALIDQVRFQSVREAAAHIHPGAYMAKVDLESAYRSVPIHPDDYQSTGLQWTFAGHSSSSWLFDTRLPFGAKCAPGIFHKISQSVRRMMIGRGFHSVFVYLYDWLIIADTQAECQRALNTLLTLLRQLGFSISYSKMEHPTTRLTFLGISIDSAVMTLSLPTDKFKELHEILATFSTKRHASQKRLQSLAGKLNWASQVIRGGRSFLRHILDSIGPLRYSRHQIKLEKPFFEDLSWWRQYLETFMGRPIRADIYRQTVTVESDSCGSGMGAVHGKDWLFMDWGAECPSVANLHINHKEAAAVIMATRWWAPEWEGCHVVIYMDNQAALAMVNKGTTRDDTMMSLLRELFWWSVRFDFSMEARYLKGEYNLFADTAFRLVNNNWLLQWALLNQVSCSIDSLDSFALSLHCHVPPSSLSLLLPQIADLGAWRRSWIEG